MVRHALLMGLFLCLSGISPAAQVVDFVRVWPGYRSAESFETIGEFFGRGEHTGGRLLLRTHPDDRNGYYFLIRLRKTDPVPGAILRIQVIFAGSPVAKVFTLPVDIPAGHPVLNAGITGADWPGAATKPLAWRVALQQADGTEIASQQSFLWAQP
jgi:hypothetical protein